MAGEIDPEGAAFRRLTGNPDGAAQAVDNAVDCGQAQTGALTHRLGGEKGIENALQDRLIHTAAVVLHGEPKVRSGFQLNPGFGRTALQAQRLQADLQNPAGVPHGFKGVAAEIHQDLADLYRIGQHQAAPRVQVLANLNSGGQGGPQQLKRLLDNGQNLQRPGFPLVLAAEGENLFDQVPGAVPGL